MNVVNGLKDPTQIGLKADKSLELRAREESYRSKAMSEVKARSQSSKSRKKVNKFKAPKG